MWPSAGARYDRTFPRYPSIVRGARSVPGSQSSVHHSRYSRDGHPPRRERDALIQLLAAACNMLSTVLFDFALT